MPNQNNTRWTPPLEARLREMHANGDSFGVIGCELGMIRSVVAGKCRRMGLTFAPRQERRQLVQRHASRTIKKPARILVPPVEPLRLLFGDLRRDVCKWIEDDRTFCGHEAKGSYCSYHSQLVYRRAA